MNNEQLNNTLPCIGQTVTVFTPIQWKYLFTLRLPSFFQSVRMHRTPWVIQGAEKQSQAVKLELEELPFIKS